MSSSATPLLMSGDMGANITSNPIVLSRTTGSLLTFAFDWGLTGTPVGDLVFEYTNSYKDNDPTTAVWDEFSRTALPASPTVKHGVTIKDFGYQAIRVKYARTSGGAGATLRCHANVRQ